MRQLISFEHYLAMLAQPALREAASPLTDAACLLVEGQADTDVVQNVAHALPACPVIGVGVDDHSPASGLFDLVVADTAEAEKIAEQIEAQAVAAACLVMLLRHNEQCSNRDGLMAESLAYSTLQQSAAFRHWLQNRPGIESKHNATPLLVVREQGVLRITLNRPHARNAYSAELKDALCAALHAAHASENLERVELRGKGDAFCAGGDLSEFGQVDDAALAHLSRMTRSAGLLLDTLPCRSVAYVHGACIGAGIELPAFADHIVAANNSYFQLPEVNMGLIPGAGGTVSVLRRIGRQRTALLALSNARLDAETALSWGLVDELADAPDP